MVKSARNDQLLVRRPRPAITESKLGYILNLSEKNGYETPQMVLTRAGIRSGGHSASDAMAKLARIAALTPPELSSIEGRSGGTDPMSCQLLGHCINHADLQFQQRKVCPECVKARGFIEAHFDLAVMTACPVHGKLLVTHCSQCSAEIRWNRPGLLKCPCGAALIRGDDSSISPAVRELLDIVRRKVLRLELGDDYSSGLPVDQLWKMSLRSLIYLIRALGRGVAGKRNAVNRDDYARIVLSAAEALADWPNGFDNRLRELTADIPDDVPLKLTAQPLSGIHYSLGVGVRPRSDAKFLRYALSEFVVNHHGSGCRDQEFRTSQSEYSKTYVSVVVLAKMWGIARDTVRQLIKRHGLPTVEVVRARSRRTLVDLTKVSLVAKAPGETYGLEDAAKAIGISPRMLSSLKETGDFHVSHLPKSLRGIHESDVMEFAERLVSKASQQTIDVDETQRSIRLECIIQRRFWTAEEKADIVRRLLNGSIEACGCDDGTVGGIQIPVSVFASLGRRERRGRTEFLFPSAPSAANDGVHRMNAIEAASYLKCSRRAVERLLAEGHIQAIKHGKTRLIEESALREFSATYVYLASVADELRTNAGALTRYCEVHGIPTISPGRGGERGNQSFILIEAKPTPLAFNDHFKSQALQRRTRRLALAA